MRQLWTYLMVDQRPPYTRDRLVNILKIAYFYNMEQVKEFAICEIEKTIGSQEHVIQLLTLARRYHAGGWLKQAFEKLLFQHIGSLIDKTDAIGARTMLCLAKTWDS